MQLNNGRRTALAAAALSLLGVAPTGQARAATTKGWSFDASTLYYQEGQGRVSAFEPKIKLGDAWGDGQSLTATGTLDAVSGATPNGATPYSRPQTFFEPHSASSSSGNAAKGLNSGYTVGPNKLPTDPNFEDLRFAFDLDYEFMPTLRDHAGVTAHASTETDFLSFATGGHWAHDFNQGNTTLSGGLNVEIDSVNPVGGAYTPLSHMPSPTGTLTTGDYGNSLGKQVYGATIAVTQLLSTTALVQLSYSATRSNGYLNDPYKILSVLDQNAAPQYYVFESRPHQRFEQSIYMQYKQFMFGDVLDASYRYFTDTWGIRSHTAELSYRLNFKGGNYLEPNVRYYHQGAANFYHVALDQGQETQLQYASADSRIGRFNAFSVGLKYGDYFSHTFEYDDGVEYTHRFNWSVQAVYYHQQNQVTGLPPNAAAALSQYKLVPSLDAGWVLLTLGF